jgi:excisionase family DNA binding protein
MTLRQYDDDAPPPAPRNQCLRIPAVAEQLDISISSVRRLIRDRQLEAIRIGSSVRVPESSVDRLLESGRRWFRPRRKKAPPLPASPNGPSRR